MKKYDVILNGSHYAQATGIAVYGVDVYISGYEQVGNSYVAVYWKNGVRTALTNANNITMATATGIYLR
ncbi:MAG: hypothetical protein ACKVOW_07580 [Chitinophagaceae bacterium]